ncbi:MAG: DUF72 domain-containing protein, partial [Dehalococcoidia bacterium]
KPRILPAMARIHIGTCSWTDKPLIQSRRFYPASAKTAEDRLRFYASIFPTVEVDSSYYALPSPDNARRWVERTPDRFTFHVKAFRLFTGHWAAPEALPADLRPEALNQARNKQRLYAADLTERVNNALWQRFEDALLPLDSAGKLGLVLFQMAPWVTPNDGAWEQIAECQRRLPQYRLAVEFRHNAWFQGGQAQQTLNALRERGLTHVVVDEPQGFESSVPPVCDVTSDVAYVRFHGRNAAMWEAAAGTSSERFDYWYRESELREWSPRIRMLMEKAGEIHVLFNTNNDTQGPDNARLFAKVLADEGLGEHIAQFNQIHGIPSTERLL